MRKKTKLLLEENNRAEEALSEKGRELLTDIVVYLRGSRISTWEQEQVRRDITQMLRDAEARGASLGLCPGRGRRVSAGGRGSPSPRTRA